MLLFWRTSREGNGEESSCEEKITRTNSHLLIPPAAQGIVLPYCFFSNVLCHVSSGTQDTNMEIYL